MSAAKAPKKPAKRATDPAGWKVSLPDAPALYGLKSPHKFFPFRHAEERLSKSRNYWICTVRPDGRQHSIPVWGFLLDGALYFGTARASCKARNLVHDPAISVHLESGDDVVILEGKVVEVDLTNKAACKKLDAASRAKYNMPMMIMPESVLYCVRPHTVLFWTEKDFPNNATRWQLSRVPGIANQAR
jgi:pyridoxamine 5'-phosphate oxidase-like protein